VSASGRRPLVAANWKMHLLQAEAASWCRAVRGELAARPAAAEGPRAVVFPSFPLLPCVARELAGSGIEVGGQDLHPADQGAHTGDVSGAQLVDAGCRWVLCGHSERRRDHGEPDDLVARKAAAAVRHGLLPLICVGETREERRAGQTFAVLERQVRALFPAGTDASAGTGGLRSFVFAYEPVWAIGTGETATPETAQEAHLFLRGLLARLAGNATAAAAGIEGRAEGVFLLYGGSVTPDNAASLFVQPDVDGFLVGGASLDPQRFLAIIRASG
jgi:triosephosphate isomerase (TIM)